MEKVIAGRIRLMESIFCRLNKVTKSYLLMRFGNFYFAQEEGKKS